jgi:hypothetical protein
MLFFSPLSTSLSLLTLLCEQNLAVNAPVDNGRSLTSRDADLTRMRNWKNRLSTQLEKLSILFSDDCTYAQALGAWSGFFQHDYWTSLAASAVTESCNLCESQSYEARDDIRGQIQSRGQRIEETTIFEGPHYIECYLIKDGVCVAIGHVDVPIGLS